MSWSKENFGSLLVGLQIAMALLVMKDICLSVCGLRDLKANKMWEKAELKNGGFPY